MSDEKGQDNRSGRAALYVESYHSIINADRLDEDAKRFQEYFQDIYRQFCWETLGEPPFGPMPPPSEKIRKDE